MVPWWLCATWRLSFALHVKQETSALWQAPGVDGFLSTPSTIQELMLAIHQIKSGKAQGPDNIPPFLIHCGPRCLEWLRGFYSNCFSNLTKPKIWRNATVIAIPKLNKPTDDPKNYRPISLLRVPFKLLERLLLARLEPIIDPPLPDEQAGFRRGRCTVHQIVNLTDDIEEAFEKGHKAGVILVDLSAAYIWHGMAPGPYLEAIPDRHLVRFISIIIFNRSFTLKTSDGQVGRLRRLKNGVPRAQSWLRHYLTSTSAISLLPRHPSTHMQTTLHSCTLIEIGRWSSWMAQHCRATLPWLPLGWNWTDNSPSNSTLRHYVAKWHQGITLYVVLLVHSGELTFVLRLRTGALALVYSAAEYAAPAWCRSTHVKKNGCYSQRHHENSQWLPTTNPSEISSCPFGNCSTCTSQGTPHVHAD